MHQAPAIRQREKMSSQTNVNPNNASDVKTPAVQEVVQGFVNSVIERMSLLESELSACAAAKVDEAINTARERAEKSSQEILDKANSEAANLKANAAAVLNSAQTEAESLSTKVSAEREKLLSSTNTECETLKAEAAAESKRLNDQTLASVDRILEDARQSAEEIRAQSSAEREDRQSEALESQSRAETAL